jgi:hypothetical protein
MNHKVSKVLTKLEFMEIKKPFAETNGSCVFSPDGPEVSGGILLLSRFLTRQEKM